jgi:type IV pilus assembly protein PilX
MVTHQFAPFRLRERRLPRRGIVLVISLIMLVLVTLIGVSAIQSSTQSERMAGNTRDRNASFQAAEAAMRKCLADAKAGTATLLNPPASGSDDLWKTASTWTGTGVVTVTVDSVEGKCFVERMLSGDDSKLRITAKSTGRSTLAEVVLQGNYEK